MLLHGEVVDLGVAQDVLCRQSIACVGGARAVRRTERPEEGRSAQFNITDNALGRLWGFALFTKCWWWPISLTIRHVLIVVNLGQVKLSPVGGGGGLIGRHMGELHHKLLRAGPLLGRRSR